MSGIRLNLGCGRRPRDGWINADLMPAPGIDLVLDLRRPLPFADDSVDEILLSHVLEHIPEPLPLAQELWRVARPGAALHLALPHGASDRAWADPTHVRPWFMMSLMYLGQPMHGAFDNDYAADWQVTQIRYTVPKEGNEGRSTQEILLRIDELRNQVIEMRAHLAARKPARPRDMSAQVWPRLLVDFSSTPQAEALVRRLQRG